MFKEVLVSFPKATPIGVKEAASQTVVLNPEDDYVIQPGTLSSASYLVVPAIAGSAKTRWKNHCE